MTEFLSAVPNSVWWLLGVAVIAVAAYAGAVNGVFKYVQAGDLAGHEQEKEALRLQLVQEKTRTDTLRREHGEFKAMVTVLASKMGYGDPVMLFKHFDEVQGTLVLHPAQARRLMARWCTTRVPRDEAEREAMQRLAGLILRPDAAPPQKAPGQ